MVNPVGKVTLHTREAVRSNETWCFYSGATRNYLFTCLSRCTHTRIRMMMLLPRDGGCLLRSFDLLAI